MVRFRIVSLALLAAAVSLSASQEYVPGIPVERASSNGSLTRAPRNLCNGRTGIFCEDCTIQMVCVGGSLISTHSCASVDLSKPFCSNNLCTSVPITNCFLDFTCTAEGYFPYPHDCMFFYICSGASPIGLPSLMTCPSGYVYDSKTGWCKQKRVAADCKTISCQNKPNMYEVFAADRSILVFCANSPSRSEILLFRCPDPVNMEYDVETMQCKFICTAEGRFPDKMNGQKYYECYRSGTKFLYFHESCPNGYLFDQVKKLCVR